MGVKAYTKGVGQMGSAMGRNVFSEVSVFTHFFCGKDRADGILEIDSIDFRRNLLMST
jgi:hypothetical protein